MTLEKFMQYFRWTQANHAMRAATFRKGYAHRSLKGRARALTLGKDSPGHRPLELPNARETVLDPSAYLNSEHGLLQAASSLAMFVYSVQDLRQYFYTPWCSYQPLPCTATFFRLSSLCARRYIGRFLMEGGVSCNEQR